MRMSKRLLTGLFIITAGRQSDALSPVESRPIDVGTPAGLRQKSTPNPQFSEQHIKEAGERLLSKMKDAPQTIESLSRLLPDVQPALIEAAIEHLIEEEEVEEILGDGTKVHPFLYLETEHLNAAIEKITTKISQGGQTLDAVKRSMPELKPELVDAVIAGLIEDGRVGTTPSSTAKNPTYVIQPRSRVG